MNEIDPPVEKYRVLDIWAVVFAMVFPTFVTLVYFLWLKDSDSAFQQIAFGIGKTLQFGFPVAWVWYWHRSKITFTRGTPTIPFTWRDIFVGLAFGLLVVASMFAIYFLLIAQTETGNGLTELVQEKVIGTGIDSFWKYIALGCFYAVCHSFLEEYYWRWFVFDFLDKFVSTPLAMVLSSLGFMAHHVVLLGFYFQWQWMTYPLSLCIAIGGMFWAWQFNKTGRLRAPWLSHLVVDAGIFALGYFLIRELL